MRTLALLVAWLTLALPGTHAQELETPEGTTIASAQVSGLDLAELSPGLQAEIARLAGSPLNRERLKELAARIEAEQPRFVAAVRAARDPFGDLRVVFVVAHLRDQDRESNVNERYPVERVEIRGEDADEISQELRDALRALEGRPLDSEEADRLETRIEEELPDHEVSRKVIRGSEPGQISVVFEVNLTESGRWIPFERPSAKFVYHSKHGWGGYFGLPFGNRAFRLTPILAINNADDLIEQYSGFGVKLETRDLGTRRLGASLEWSAYEQDWEPETLTAVGLNPRIPQAYESRSTITPQLTFALSPRFRISGGVSISELDPLSGVPDSQMANAAVFSVGFAQRWKDDSHSSHRVEALASLRKGTDTLESDLEYTRYFGQASYRARWDRHRLVLSGMGGDISGDAPLFERFSLGDSQTLRGWNKYDVAPAGGDRMVHGTFEYRYAGFALFLDTGAVWDRGLDPRVRVSAGAGFHEDNFFMTLGFPLNTGGVRAIFSMGIRY
jgi:hypothetical protein